MTVIFMRKERSGDTEIHRREREPSEGKSRFWSDTVTSQGMPMIASNYQKLQKGERQFFSRTFRESLPLARFSF